MPRSLACFESLVKLQLRSILRREVVNKTMKTLCMVQIINMYRVMGNTEFYPRCVKEVA